MNKEKLKIDGYDKTNSYLAIGTPIKKYQFMYQDIYDNLYEIGYFDELNEDVVKAINEEISIYKTKVTLEQLQAAEKESPYGGGLDVTLYEDDDEELGDAVLIRCFIHQ